MPLVEVELDSSVVTKACATQFVRSIIEFLLYDRLQIPLPYNAFRQLVKSRTLPSEDDLPVRRANIKLRKDLEQAQQTVTNVDNLFEIISKCVEHSPSIREVLILLGSTIYTAKEAFHVRMPTIDVNHHGINHGRDLKKDLMKLNRALITSDEFNSIRPVQMPTNVHVMVKASNLPPNVEEDLFTLLDDYEVPPKCPIFYVQLNSSPDATPLNCCNRLEVFRDNTFLQKSSAHTDIEATTITAESSGSWLQLNIITRGFNQCSSLIQ
uniref:MAD2L1-binding protein n=2 Tax=Anopheles albimanus TaxID=7167 RepID=A0A182FBE0_ANOAL